jgi:hypothetical protein
LPENPLLPHRKLQELYGLMERCRTLEKKQRAPVAREAILAATSIHLEPGDFISAPASDHTLASLAPESKSDAPAPAPFATHTSRLTLAAATARGQQLSGNNLTLAWATAHTAEPWIEAVTLAQTHRLPFILCVPDAPPRRISKKTDALTWPALDPLCRRIHLPTLTVDGEDAVAVYRVMQEATLRARTGLGPSVIWAMLSPADKPPARTRAPISRLKKYLAARSIPLPQ